MNIDNLKEGILDYMFDSCHPLLYTNEYGFSYKTYWNETREKPDERKVKFNYEEIYSISEYENDKIVKL